MNSFNYTILITNDGRKNLFLHFFSGKRKMDGKEKHCHSMLKILFFFTPMIQAPLDYRPSSPAS